MIVSEISNQNEVVGRWFLDPNDIDILLTDIDKNQKSYQEIKDAVLNGYIIEIYESRKSNKQPSGKAIIYLYDYDKNVNLNFKESWKIDNNILTLTNNYSKQIEFSHFNESHIYFKTQNNKLIKFYKDF